MEIYSVIPQRLDVLASPAFAGLTTGSLTLNMTQDYLFTEIAATQALAIQSQTSGQPFALDMFTKDGDSTDFIDWKMYGLGTPGSLVNTEFITCEFDPPTHFAIYTQKTGTGTVRPLRLFTGANTTQLVLNTDNSISMSGAVNFTGDVTTINYGNAGAFDTLQFIGNGTVLEFFKILRADAANDMTLALTATVAGWSAAKNMTFSSSDESITFTASTVGKNITLTSPDILLKGEVEAGGSTTKIKLTSIGGYAVKLTNKTGANSIAGAVVSTSTGTNDAVQSATNDELEPIGVFLDAGVPDGSEAWIVEGGIADVAMEDNTTATRGNWVRTSITDGPYADATNAAAPQPINQTHFTEIGHCIETVTATGGGTHILARCKLHFN